MDLVAPGSEEAMLPLWGPLARQLRGVRRVWDSRGGEVRAPGPHCCLNWWRSCIKAQRSRWPSIVTSWSTVRAAEVQQS